MKIFYKILLIVSLLISESAAQNELKFEFDYARFKYDSTLAYLEFYYELNSQGMLFSETEKGKIAEAIIHIEVKNVTADSLYINKKWKIQQEQKDTVLNSNEKNLVGVMGFTIPEGNYVVNINAYDSKNPELKKIISEKLSVVFPTEDKYTVSDIQLASNIKAEGDPSSIFYKNTLEIIPNPTMLYSVSNPVVFYYAELYKLNLSDDTTKFTLQKLIYNSSGVSVYKKSKILKQDSNSVVEYGLINMSKYPSDSYNIVLSLIDNKTNQAFISSKRFFLYNPNIVDTAGGHLAGSEVLGSTFGIMTIEECDRMFLEAKYIATQSEIDRYKSLDSLNAKRNFLLNFWKGRDLDISTTQNEFQIDYMRRAEYANQHFKHANKEGFLSDRGRIYITYGEPDQRDIYPNESNLKPYEVWFYNQIEGGVSFVFGDISGFGNYELLHSTKRGEVSDINYMQRLSTE
ncbi:MAG: GWxTD domain-containing protein [Ignavibacteriales bacterium]|nr:GWxTD domain-containing protein [Ignavibacteriales bacterium]